MKRSKIVIHWICFALGLIFSGAGSFLLSTAVYGLSLREGRRIPFLIACFAGACIVLGILCIWIWRKTLPGAAALVWGITSALLIVALLLMNRMPRYYIMLQLAAIGVSAMITLGFLFWFLKTRKSSRLDRGSRT